MRIRQTRWKAAYLIAGYGVLLAFEWLVPLPYLAHYVIGSVLMALYIVVAVRTFRGSDEPVAPPRLWWRMTARPRAGFWLAGVFVVACLAALDGTTRPAPAYGIADTAQSLAIGLLYLHSSIRLVRSRQARPAERSRPATD